MATATPALPSPRLHLPRLTPRLHEHADRDEGVKLDKILNVKALRFHQALLGRTGAVPDA